jgi:PTS system nitrogen regulatory IIA component
MKIDEFLSFADTLIDLRAQDKHRLLQDLCGRAAAALNLNAEQICQDVEARESLGSTGMGSGIGLPHARLDAIAKPFGILARLKRPIEFDAIDGQPVDLVFFLLLPAASADDNLNTLAGIARKLREPERLERLRQAADASDLHREMAR